MDATPFFTALKLQVEAMFTCHTQYQDHHWLVDWTPLKNISQLGWLFPIYGKIKHFPNYQPVNIEIIKSIGGDQLNYQPSRPIRVERIKPLHVGPSSCKMVQRPHENYSRKYHQPWWHWSYLRLAIISYISHSAHVSSYGFRLSVAISCLRKPHIWSFPPPSCLVNTGWARLLGTWGRTDSRPRPGKRGPGGMASVVLMQIIGWT